MCINPNKRAATSHVEFETDGWISVFNVALSLSRVIKVYGEAFAHATPAELVSAIETVTHNIMMVCTLADNRLDRDKFKPPVYHNVTFAGTSHYIIQFDVLDGWVSFHHSLQWLLAELFKHVDILSEHSLRSAGYASLRDVIMQAPGAQAMQTIIDYPLRGMVLVVS